MEPCRSISPTVLALVHRTGPLVHMLGLPASPQDAHLARLGPEALQRATFAAVRAVVAQLAERGPTVLVLEDLHWAGSPLFRPPDEVVSLARGAKEAWDYKSTKRVTRMLSQAVELASQLGYC
jgi:hypothetical protein